MKKASFRRNALWAAAFVLLAIAVFSLPRSLVGGAPGPDDAPVYPHAELSFQRADGTVIPFHVEVATTPHQMAYGLMFRHSLAHDAGMIFIQGADYPATFWMENTLIPLDMVFVRHDGTIAKIAVNAKPLDLSPIRSDEPVRAIIEINGGEAARRGLQDGDKVIFPGLGPNN